ncbi:MAG: hypothetical protein ABH825_01205 [Candidatus Omnitrophota bacterium]
MRTCKCIFWILPVTVFALLYVHQQTQLVEVGYKVQADEELYTQLLDRNRVLMYNITQLKSPNILHTRLAASDKEFRVPLEWQIVKAKDTVEPQEMSLARSQEKTGLLGIFRFKTRVAEARPIK